MNKRSELLMLTGKNDCVAVMKVWRGDSCNIEAHAYDQTIIQIYDKTMHKSLQTKRLIKFWKNYS